MIRPRVLCLNEEIERAIRIELQFVAISDGIATYRVSNEVSIFVVGEERNSAGAYHAAQHPRGSKYIVNGEPTSNHLALGSKGALRYEVVARGRMAMRWRVKNRFRRSM